jgi:hypothetical protein
MHYRSVNMEAFQASQLFPKLVHLQPRIKTQTHTQTYKNDGKDIWMSISNYNFCMR